MGDDGAEARMFDIYRRLADARRGFEEQLDDPLNLPNSRALVTPGFFLNLSTFNIGVGRSNGFIKPS
jgi:hypothetical protein